MTQIQNRLFNQLKKARHCLAFSLLLGIVACRSNDTLPAGILNHDQMVALMVDVELLQAELKYDFSKANIQIDPEPRFEVVFNEHSINKEQFNKNLEYYGAHPLQMKDIYIDVLEQLSTQQAQMK